MQRYELVDCLFSASNTRISMRLCRTLTHRYTCRPSPCPRCRTHTSHTTAWCSPGTCWTCGPEGRLAVGARGIRHNQPFTCYHRKRTKLMVSERKWFISTYTFFRFPPLLCFLGGLKQSWRGESQFKHNTFHNKNEVKWLKCSCNMEFQEDKTFTNVL